MSSDPGVAELPRAALTAGRNSLSEFEAKQLLAAAGVPVPKNIMIEHADELPAALSTLRAPLVLKVMSPEVLHKSDIGGVFLNLTSADDIREAMDATAAVPGRTGWLLEEMAGAGHELVVGGVRHPRFGPMVMVGLGGVLVEYLDDVALRICPITADDAEAMLASLRTAPLLNGVRGRPGVDKAAVVEVLLQTGGVDGLLMRHADTIAELDINPLIATADGAIAVDGRVLLAEMEPERPSQPVADLMPLLEPRAVAVVGASTGGTAQANQYLRNLRAYGYSGDLFAIHPKATEIDGVPAYPGFSALPSPVDYAYVSVAAPRCAALLEGARGQVKFAQVMSGGFGEGGSDRTLEDGLLDVSNANDIRVLGPNCMGTHSPAGKLTYMSGVDPTCGHVSVVAQSGGLSTDVLRRGAQRGLQFRSLVTVGNSADVGPAELIQALMDDGQTHVLGLYIEDARRGRQLFDALRRSRGQKPVAMLIGGMTDQGSRAAQSHTGALAGDARAWGALAEQCGVAITHTLDEFLDVMLAMQQLRPVPGRVTRDVVMFGNGGGTSVLAADAFGRAGLNVPLLPPASRRALEALNLPQGTSIANPIDAPAMSLAREDGAVARRIVDGIFAHAHPDAFVIHMNVPVILGYSHADILGNLMGAVVASRESGIDAHVLMVLRSDGEAEIEQLKAGMRARALAAGIPVYNELVDAAKALAGYARFESARLPNPDLSSSRLVKSTSIEKPILRETDFE